MQRFDNSGDNSPTIHLAAAAKLYAAAERPPSNTHQVLITEAFIYQIAINSTFRPSCLSNYDDLSGIINVWLRSPALQRTADNSPFTKAGLSSWLPIWTLNIIFKASYLLRYRNIVSSEDIQVKVHELQIQLNDLQQAVSASKCAYDVREKTCSEGLEKSGNSQAKSLPKCESSPHISSSDEGFHMRELYSLAISLLLAKIARPTITAETPTVTSISKTALFHLRHVRSDIPCLLWAITVLATAVNSMGDRFVISAHLEAMRHFAGERAISSVLSFLSLAWGQSAACCLNWAMDNYSGDEFGISPVDSEQLSTLVEEGSAWKRPLGLDILFEESLLELVIL
ncbi:hypothetical protein EIK77_009229 [Talaromyces pinophilus]|nr:hypothetical protein EIK77_009229 [Talaromyces pinophilus]